jgi:predicted transcriptional regulator
MVFEEIGVVSGAILASPLMNGLLYCGRSGSSDRPLSDDLAKVACMSTDHAASLEAELVMHSLSRVDELFHRVGRAIPANQQVLTLHPDMPAKEAIGILNSHFYSQAPVAIGTRVLGVFSFRSFAQKSAAYSLDELKRLTQAPGDLPVEDCMETYNYAHLSDELHQHFDALERDNGVLIGDPENVSAILTPMDVLRYLYKLASPFVYLQEIELAIRALIRSAASEEEIRVHACTVLKRKGSEGGAV